MRTKALSLSHTGQGKRNLLFKNKKGSDLFSHAQMGTCKRQVSVREKASAEASEHGCCRGGTSSHFLPLPPAVGEMPAAQLLPTGEEPTWTSASAIHCKLLFAHCFRLLQVLCILISLHGLIWNLNRLLRSQHEFVNFPLRAEGTLAFPSK